MASKTIRKQENPQMIILCVLILSAGAVLMSLLNYLGEAPRLHTYRNET